MGGRGFRKPAIGILLFIFVNFSLVLAATGLSWEGMNPVERVDLAVYGVINANRTGQTGVARSDGELFPGYLRSLPNQKVHSGFSLNTNSCASCHMTHTAPGEALTFQRSVYNTCTTCHFDATITTYNVLTDASLSGGRFYDGDFTGVGDRAGVSYHLATGLKTIGDAPGADRSRPGWWEMPFTCGSCHAPHGSYSSRHLTFNPNGQARRFGPAALTEGADGKYRPALTEDKAPWLFYETDSAYFADYGVVIRNAVNQVVTDEFFINYHDGYAVPQGNPGPAPYTVTFSQAVVVLFDVQNLGQPDESVSYRAGQVNFCTSCHTGYLQETVLDGQTHYYTHHAGFEHPVNSDISGYVGGLINNPDQRFRLEEEGTKRRLVCLSCHFAHGTDAGLIRDSLFNLMYPDGAGAPANTHLLRFGERQSCLVCHATPPADTLTIIATDPVDGSVTAGVPPAVGIIFDRRVDTAAVPGNIAVYDSVSLAAVPGSFSYEDSQRKVVFTPDAGSLAAGNSYTVDVTTGVRSLFGRALPAPYRFNFTVGPP